MKADTEKASGAYDRLKWAVVLLLVAVGVWGNQYYSGESVLYRVLALLALAAVAAFVAAQTETGARFVELLKASRAEIRKVVWPNRQEWTQTTLVVIVFVLVVALLLWGVDSLISWVIATVIG
ncbi:preprotein translocase subunit SecE [Hahella sp. SMD15-11]|uniref:Protein translocase subunit SecE n=1 Tax=Thermohahella caldifontis TaxID=3142973 RepID=A0AB39UUU5_9GAMM